VLPKRAAFRARLPSTPIDANESRAHRSDWAQISEPDTRTQSDVGVQQSADVVQDAPSSEHAAAQARAAPWPPQFPAQHSAVKAHVPPSAMHDVAIA
jgi:hypothetical protein